MCIMFILLSDAHTIFRRDYQNFIKANFDSFAYNLNNLHWFLFTIDTARSDQLNNVHQSFVVSDLNCKLITAVLISQYLE